MKILCLDIGNTHTHYAVMEARRSVFSGTLKTGEIDDAQNGVPALLRSPELAIFDIAGVSFCSVVPVATEKVFRKFGHQNERERTDQCCGDVEERHDHAQRYAD